MSMQHLSPNMPPPSARFDPRDPDASLVPIFRHSIVLNPARTAAEGRPIYDDVETVEIKIPGSRSTSGVHPVTEVSHWSNDPYTGEQRTVTYAERFHAQYQQFRTNTAQTKSGTPLEHLPKLTPARRAELHGLNIYTVEALAAIDGQELKNLGQGGRELKNSALDYLEVAKRAAPGMQLVAEVEALRAQQLQLMDDNESLRARVAEAEARRRDDELKRHGRPEDDWQPNANTTAQPAEPFEVNQRLVDELARLRNANAELTNTSAALQRQLDEPPPVSVTAGEMQFDQMTNEALREYIRANAGAVPRGNSPRNVLVRMAADCAQRLKDATGEG